MTRRDYELIAATISRAFEWVERQERICPGSMNRQRIKESVAGEFERQLSENNPRFDKYKFADACNKQQT
jgi:hypothetical protein